MAEDDLNLSDDEPISLESAEEPISLESSDDADAEPIKLSEPSGGSSRSAVRAFGAGAVQTAAKEDFQRALNLTGQGATRCRLFHSKIAIAPLHHMETQINEWLDSDQIEVKQVGHLIGTMEGKKPEPNVIVLVWY